MAANCTAFACLQVSFKVYRGHGEVSTHSDPGIKCTSAPDAE